MTEREIDDLCKLFRDRISRPGARVEIESSREVREIPTLTEFREFRPSCHVTTTIRITG